MEDKNKEETKKVEQQPLFGDRDFVYNVLNGQLLNVRSQIKSCDESISRKRTQIKELDKEREKIVKALEIVGEKPDDEEPEEATEVEEETDQRAEEEEETKDAKDSF